MVLGFTWPDVIAPACPSDNRYYEQLLCSKTGYISEKGSFPCPHGIYVLIGERVIGEVIASAMAKGDVLQGGMGVLNVVCFPCLGESGSLPVRSNI